MTEGEDYRPSIQHFFTFVLLWSCAMDAELCLGLLFLSFFCWDREGGLTQPTNHPLNCKRRQKGKKEKKDWVSVFLEVYVHTLSILVAIISFC